VREKLQKRRRIERESMGSFLYGRCRRTDAEMEVEKRPLKGTPCEKYTSRDTREGSVRAKKTRKTSVYDTGVGTKNKEKAKKREAKRKTNR